MSSTRVVIEADLIDDDFNRRVLSRHQEKEGQRQNNQKFLFRRSHTLVDGLVTLFLLSVFAVVAYVIYNATKEESGSALSDNHHQILNETTSNSTSSSTALESTQPTMSALPNSIQPSISIPKTPSFRPLNILPPSFQPTLSRVPTTMPSTKSLAPSATPSNSPRPSTSMQPSFSSWDQLGRDLDGSDSSANFGISLALSDDGRTLAVGQIRFYKVYIFDWNITANDWTHRGDAISVESPYGGPNFGFFVDLSGTARVFEWDEYNNSWKMKGLSSDGGRVTLTSRRTEGMHEYTNGGIVQLLRTTPKMGSMMASGMPLVCQYMEKISMTSQGTPWRCQLSETSLRSRPFGMMEKMDNYLIRAMSVYFLMAETSEHETKASHLINKHLIEFHHFCFEILHSIEHLSVSSSMLRRQVCHRHRPKFPLQKAKEVDQKKMIVFTH